MKNVAIKGPAKAFMMSISNFFITLQYQLKMFTKVMLSSAEQNAVKNPEYILTKNRVISKVYDLFGLLADNYKLLNAKMQIPQNILLKDPKISRGENYQALPYVMLDYPRIFDQKDTCAIRSFFWWGHYFSITIHLKGRYQPCINLDKLKNTSNQWLYITGDEEWEHHLHQGNTQILNAKNIKQIQKLHSAKTVCRIAQKMDLDNWENIGQLFQTAYSGITQSMNFSHLNDE